MSTATDPLLLLFVEPPAGSADYSGRHHLNGTPCLVAQPSSGFPTQSTTLSGTHFGSTEGVNIYWDSTSGVPLTTTTADVTGSFTVTTTVPQATSGTHTVIAVGQSSGHFSSIPFRVTPILQLASGSGRAGASLVVLGGGYGLTTGIGGAITETVTLYWLPGATVLGTTTSRPAGAFVGSVGPLTVTVPLEATPGPYNVCGLGDTSGVASCRLYTVTG